MVMIKSFNATSFLGHVGLLPALSEFLPGIAWVPNLYIGVKRFV